MIRNSTGFIQIQHHLYWDDKSIDHTMDYTNAIRQSLEQSTEISSITPRLEYFALASTGKLTKGTAVIGIQPEVEKQRSKMHEKMIAGQFLQEARQSVLVAKNLAQYLNASIGDTIVLFGQGYHGITAAGKYWVEGIVDFHIPLLNTSLLFLHLEDAQQLFAAPNRLTNVSLMLADPTHLLTVQKTLQQQLDSTQYQVLNWKQMNADYVKQASTKDVSTGIMIGILYLIVGFGIFGTLFMMALERKREFSVMIAVGMKRNQLAVVVFLESIFLGLVGVLTGVLISLPLLAYLNLNPIVLTGEMAAVYAQYNIEPEFHFDYSFKMIFQQLLIIFTMSTVLAIVPVWSVLRLNFVNGLRGR